MQVTHIQIYTCTQSHIHSTFSYRHIHLHRGVHPSILLSFSYTLCTYVGAHTHTASHAHTRFLMLTQGEHTLTHSLTHTQPLMLLGCTPKAYRPVTVHRQTEERAHRRWQQTSSVHWTGVLTHLQLSPCSDSPARTALDKQDLAAIFTARDRGRRRLTCTDGTDVRWAPWLPWKPAAGSHPSG